MQIGIDVKNKIATLQDPDVFIVCYNSDYTILFNFDSEWEDHDIKTAHFSYIYNGSHRHIDVVFDGSICEIPILTDVKSIEVGVSSGDLHTTTPCLIKCERSAHCGIGVRESEIFEVQPDWSQNDDSKPNHIKNRTHWKEEIDFDPVDLPYDEEKIDPEVGAFVYPHKLNLYADVEYVVDIEYTDETVKTVRTTATHTPIAPNAVALVTEDFQVIDGVIFDPDSQSTIPADNCYYVIESDVKKITVRLENPTTIYHKLDEEYLPDSVPTREDVEEIIDDHPVSNVAKYAITGLQFQEPVLLCDEYIDTPVYSWLHDLSNKYFKKIVLVGWLEFSNVDTSTIDISIRVGPNNYSIPIQLVEYNKRIGFHLTIETSDADNTVITDVIIRMCYENGGVRQSFIRADSNSGTIGDMIGIECGYAFDGQVHAYNVLSLRED